MTPKLTMYHDKTPVLQKEAEKEAPLKTLGELIQSLQFFAFQIQEGTAKKETVNTHMNLFESYYKELAGSTGYSSILAENLKARTKEIRELNLENQRLTALLGKSVNAEAATGFLRSMEASFRAWYEAAGFHYASLENTTSWGFLFDFSSELAYDPEDARLCKEEEKLFQKIRQVLPVTAKALEHTGDIRKDSYHADLLDTENAKKYITGLLKAEFPDTHVGEWRSRSNHEDFLLRFKIYVPFRDIEKMREKYLSPENQGRTES